MDALPALPLKAWQATKDTLHLWTQIVGKIRLALAPKRNHWWHVSLRPSPRGLSTEWIPTRAGGFEIEFDLVGHGLDLRTSEGDAVRMPLHDGLSVAEFYRRLFANLEELDIRPHILAKPYDLASKTPFERDDRHASYDAAAVEKFAMILQFAASVLEEFAGRFTGKTSPVHFFWHAFDLALTRFSGRRSPPMPGADPVTREAYTHEVASFGFWPGDDETPRPGFYAYASPAPSGIASHRLSPRAAMWVSPNDAMANLAYDVVRKSRDPRKTLLSFLESAFEAATTSASWAAVDASRAQPKAPAN